MLTLDEIIKKILSTNPNLTLEHVEEMIHQKREEVGGLLTEEGAAYILAAELGVDLSEERELKTRIQIQDLVAGVNDVTITGRVLLVYPTQTFTRSNGSEGKVARMVIADKTGMLNVVLWDDKAEAVSSKGIFQNQIARFLHGYARTGLDGKPELNVGIRGGIVTSPTDVNPEDYPEVKDFFKKIRELKDGEYNVNLVGIVTRVSSPSVFERKSGIAGQVKRVSLADETGKIRAVFWNGKVDEIRDVKRGDCLQIMRARVKRNIRGRIEIHVGKGSQISILAEKPPGMELPPIEITKISELKPDMPDVNVLGRVVHVGSIREFQRSSGRVGRVADVLLKDETGTARLAMWDDQTDSAKVVLPGDVVLVEGAYTRKSLRGVDLNLGRFGLITINPDLPEAEFLPSVKEEVIPIGQLRLDLRNATVEGIVTEVPIVREVVTMNGQVVKVASFRIKDETGEVRVSVWRKLVETAEKLVENVRVRIVNAYVKAGLGEALELSSGSLTSIEILYEPPTTDELPQVIITEESVPSKIKDLKEGEVVEVQATIVNLSKTSHVYPACPKCFKKVVEKDEQWICERCGPISKMTPRLVIDIVIDDGTGVMNATFTGNNAEKLIEMSAERAWNIITKTEDKEAFIETVRSKVLGTKITILGSTEYDRFTKSLRLVAKEFNKEMG